MGFLVEQCTLWELTKEVLEECKPFVCDKPDLNEFFEKDAFNYQQELMGKSYCFRLDKDPTVIICAFTVANDSIKANLLPNSRKKKVNKDVPRAKQMRSYPAVLIGRLGVSKDWEGKGLGRELMDFVKSWFINPNNKTGCRFVVVDAYNVEGPLNYYLKNGFSYLFSTEEQERNYTGVPEDRELETRLMYFDLIAISSNNEGQ